MKDCIYLTTSPPFFLREYGFSNPCCCFPYSSSTLLAFIMELLKNSIAMQEQMLACKGFLVIGYSLEKVKDEMLYIFDSYFAVHETWSAKKLRNSVCKCVSLVNVKLHKLKQPVAVLPCPHSVLLNLKASLTLSIAWAPTFFWYWHPLTYFPCFVLIVTFEISSSAVFQSPCQQSSTWTLPCIFKIP